ncbi:MAG: hypothetical protein ACLFNT_07345 [Spirochaetales bacterium]
MSRSTARVVRAVGGDQVNLRRLRALEKPVPESEPFDPRSPTAIHSVQLDRPYWVKPVRATGSAFDCEVQLAVGQGDHLTFDPTEDAYAHDAAFVFSGADSWSELERNKEQIMHELDIEVEGV